MNPGADSVVGGLRFPRRESVKEDALEPSSSKNSEAIETWGTPRRRGLVGQTRLPFDGILQTNEERCR